MKFVYKRKNIWIFAPKINFKLFTRHFVQFLALLLHKNWNWEGDIIGDFHTVCSSAEHKNGEKLDNDFISRNEQFGFQGKMMWVLCYEWEAYQVKLMCIFFFKSSLKIIQGFPICSSKNTEEVRCKGKIQSFIAEWKMSLYCWSDTFIVASLKDLVFYGLLDTNLHVYCSIDHARWTI